MFFFVRVPQKCKLFCHKMSTIIYVALLKIFHQNLPCWNIFICFVEKFPQNFSFLKYFNNNLLCQKISIKHSLLKKIPQQFAFLEHFHKTVLYWKFQTKIPLFEKFPQRFSFLEDFLNICFVGPFPQQFASLKKLH